MPGRHAVPHYCRYVDVSEAARREVEHEAKVFAAELGMSDAGRGRGAPSSIADYLSSFGVSEEATHWRFHNLAEGTST
jgi:Zn-dependent peptidase ImmA (M78 family)